MYKANVSNFEKGKHIGSRLLEGSFDTIDSALTEAASQKEGDMSVIEVRVYDETKGVVIAWDNPQTDTGVTIYRDYQDVANAIDEEYWALYGSDSFDGTFQSLLDMIKNGAPDGIGWLKAPLASLTDNEINEIAETFTGLEHSYYSNGEFHEHEPLDSETKFYIYSQYPNMQDKICRELKDSLSSFSVAFVNYGQMKHILKKDDLFNVIGFIGEDKVIDYAADCFDHTFYFNQYACDTNKLFEDVRDEIISKKRTMDFIEDIKNGKRLVKFITWGFSGGHGEDVHMFEVSGRKEDETADVLIEVNNMHLDIHEHGRDCFNTYLYIEHPTVTDLYIEHPTATDRFIRVAATIIRKATVRDDLELIAVLKKQLPPWADCSEYNIDHLLRAEYYDVDREDLLKGEYAAQILREYLELEISDWKTLWRIEHNGSMDAHAAWMESDCKSMGLEELYAFNKEYAQKLLAEKFDNNIDALLNAESQTQGCWHSNRDSSLRKYVCPVKNNRNSSVSQTAVIKKKGLLYAAERVIIFRETEWDREQDLHIYENPDFLVISTREISVPELFSIHEETSFMERTAPPKPVRSSVSTWTMPVNALEREAPHEYAALAEWVIAKHAMRYSTYTNVEEKTRSDGQKVLLLHNETDLGEKGTMSIDEELPFD